MMLPSSTIGAEGSFMRFIYGTLAAMSMFITAYDKNDRVRDKYHMDEDKKLESFDFVIVGGGTAGSIIGKRLSEKYSVLILEAGGEPFPIASIPGFATYMMMNHTEIDWGYKTVSQKFACQAMKKHRCAVSQGKGLGGSSNLGYLNFIRGSPFCYENWANLTGSTAWKYSSLLPFFKRSEDYDGAWMDPLTHGFGGEFHLQSPNYTGMGNRFIKAGMEMKYKRTDLSGLFTEGFDYILSPLLRGYRQTTNSAYLKSIKRRQKLTIKKFANVKRILFQKDNNSLAAYGVVYEKHGKVLMALASREVILSAGAVNTPKLLMLSGIGSKNHLQSMKIQVVKDVPAVGKNLQDHLITFIGPFLLNSSASFLMERDVTPESVARFGMAEGQGPLTSTGIHANAIIASSQQKFTGNLFWPDIHMSLYGMAHHNTTDQEFSEMYNMDPEVAEKYFNKTKGQDSFSIILTVGRPHSRGRVRLTDPNPDTMPMINPRYLSDTRDMNIMLDGIYRAFSLIENSKAFQEIGATLSEEPFPGCEGFEFKSKEYWQCYLTRFSMSGNNLVGTCAMGTSNDKNAVVDPDLKLKGVQRLRIIDASVMPTITVGGTLAPVMVIAEKGAEIVRKFWDDLAVLKII